MKTGLTARFKVEGIDNRVGGGAMLTLAYQNDAAIPNDRRWNLPSGADQTIKIELPDGGNWQSEIVRGSTFELALTPVSAETHAEAATR